MFTPLEVTNTHIVKLSNKCPFCALINKKAGDLYCQIYPASLITLLISIRSALTLSYSEHLGSTRWTYTLCRWPSILHGYAFGILHFSFGAAFHTVCLHWLTSLFEYQRQTIPPLNVNSLIVIQALLEGNKSLYCYFV